MMTACILLVLNFVYQEEAQLPPVVDYIIEAKLLPEIHTIEGRQTLKYTNHSPDIISDLQFHMYLNASRDSKSTYYQEYLRIQGEPWLENSTDWGSVTILTAQVDGTEVTSQLEYIQAEDSLPTDQTVLRMPLPAPLFPGQTIEVQLEFLSVLPRKFSRTGYVDDYFFCAQWFPKVGVWETRGFRDREVAGWNCHAFHANTEFYANFGTYDVTLDVPKKFVVGATGNLVDKREGEERTRYHFQQDRVHDFAWTAYPDFVRLERTFEPSEWVTEAEIAQVMKTHLIAREEALLKPVKMIQLIQPHHKDQAERHFQALALALKYHGLWFGAYPYETLTMVDPPPNGRFSGGMEYPTFIANGTRIHNPKDDLDLEDLIIHEFGHQYWYGIVASNEFEEAWLDEGINTYVTALIQDMHYGPHPFYERLGDRRVSLDKLLGLVPPTRIEICRQLAFSEGGVDPVVKDAWTYRSDGYGRNAYYKPATRMAQLQRELGDETMARVMRGYYQRWKFKHPNTQDFIDVVEDVAERDMDWFFEPLFFQTGYLDFRVGQVEDNWARLEKDGNLVYPVDILVRFDDGTEQRLQWDGQGRWHRLSFPGPAKIVSIQLDPERKILIDDNTANNSYRVTTERKSANRWSMKLGGFIQNLLQTMAGGF